MRLQDIYRIALARGLTAKEAGAEFGVNPSSISKMKTRHGFPPLRYTLEKCAEDIVGKMTDKELQDYLNVLLEKKPDHRDVAIIKKEQAMRVAKNPDKPCLLYDNVSSKNRRK